MKRKGQRAICVGLMILAVAAAFLTEVVPVLTPVGGVIVSFISLAFSTALWPPSEDVPMPRGQEHDR
ncbi:hypothetical protein [Paenibacillus sp.]|uniref:hypothetical protein n=1 Tax=Paenibacillus sp. TaxID=58172 RepID=UPI002D2FA506|nr:hypothetical protein [Paenibacillus sp.]HZG87326.1 hypothetical protein [Paenibacillus sp.]